MNRKLKETSVDRDYYDSQEQLREHLVAFLLAYNLAKRLKPLRGLTPYEYLCQHWQQQPERFLRDPFQDTLGLNT